VKWSVIMIIRATQKKMMSKPVTSTELGSVAIEAELAIILSAFGQPMVLNGHSAEENQVSSTSGPAAAAHRRYWPARALRLRCGRHRCCRLVEPRRNAVAPPELAADAPVLDVLHPVAVGVDPVRRHELHLAGFDELQAALGQRVHLHEPLVGQERLDHLAGAVAARHLQACGLIFDQQAGGVEVGEHQLARVEAIQAAIFFRRCSRDDSPRRA
jgi:hypothetical protein